MGRDREPFSGLGCGCVLAMAFAGIAVLLIAAFFMRSAIFGLP